MQISFIISIFAGLALALPATTCPSSPIILDRSFESGVTPPTSGGPWTVYAFIGSSSYSLTKPGSPNGGRYAFTASIYPGPFTNGLSGETLNQTLTTCPGRNYSITADYKFNATTNNDCSIRLEYPYKNTVGSVTTGSGIPGVVAGSWATTGSTFQAVSNASTLSVVFACKNNARNLISVDNFKVAKFNGNAY